MLVLTFSSAPSEQSRSPSQRHLAVIQYLSEHWNCLIGSQFAFAHLASSLDVLGVRDENQ